MKTPSTNPSDLLQALNWRYATKAFDPTQKIPAQIWSALEQALVLTPSSYGLQPWKFLVLTDASLREKLLAVSWGQRQVADCSHFVVLTARQNLGMPEIERWADRLSEVQGVPREKLNGYQNMMAAKLVHGPKKEIINEWAARQVYIALGNLMTSAAALGIDACPMEGIEPEKYDEILGLKGSGYATVVACATGYRSPQDKYASAPKVRYEAKDIIDRR